MHGFDVESVGVVQEAVVGLSDDRQRPKSSAEAVGAGLALVFYRQAM